MLFQSNFFLQQLQQFFELILMSIFLNFTFKYYFWIKLNIN